MKNTFKRLAGWYAGLAGAFLALKNNLLHAAFPRPAYQRVTVPVSRPKAVRINRKW